MQAKNWRCPKCNHDQFETDEIRVAGSGLASVFDIENRKYLAIVCERCSFTEFYRATSNTAQKVIDFLTT